MGVALMVGEDRLLARGTVEEPVKLLTVIQARMSSQRLPGKVLMDLGGQTVLERVIGRIRDADLPGEIVVATTWEYADDPIERLCARVGVHCFRGNPVDVLQRFHETVLVHGGDTIVRVTADCPLLDPVLLHDVALKMAKGVWDYVGVKGAPDGWHQEAFTKHALALADRLAVSRHDREHVVTFMLERPAMFRLGWVQANIQGPPVTLDTADDLERLRGMVAA